MSQDQYDDSFEPQEGFGLSEFDEEFSSAEAPSFEEVPDGKYQTRIQSVKLDRSQKGDPMIKWDLVVISGRHEGRHIFKNSVITSAALPFVKADLKTAGLELSRLSELEARLEELLDVLIEVTKRTRDDFANVYFNKRLQLAGGYTPPVRSGDDCPF